MLAMDYRKFVNETFASCTPTNKAAVEAELKRAIFKAFESNQLWTIDWPNYKLKAYVVALSH